jgi:glycosyltransferase involved in cell wall biosynthesis
VHTLQLTWATDDQLESTRRAAARLGTKYTSARVSARIRRLGLPLSIGFGAVLAARYVQRERIDVLFPRSLIPMAMALLAHRARSDSDLVFEADGLMADERADFGGWSKRGPSYRLLRRVEAEGVRQARSVICRTRAAREILVERAGGPMRQREKIFVAPNAKDPREFTPATSVERAATRRRHGIPVGTPWVVYVGSIGPQYLPDQMIAAMARIREREPTTRFSLFTFQDGPVRSLLANEPELAKCMRIERAAPSDVPAILAAADLGFALRLQSFSQQAICPIKVAEYLLCGLPVVTSGVGDLIEQLDGQPAAFLTQTRAGEGPAIADWFVRHVLPRRDELRESARTLGLKWFDLERSVDTYEAALLYRKPVGTP